MNVINTPNRPYGRKTSPTGQKKTSFAEEVLLPFPVEILTAGGVQLSLAFMHFEAELEKELITEGRQPIWKHGRLMLHTAGPAPLWAATVWLEPELVTISSIGEAIKKLSASGPFWGQVDGACHRRAALIAEGLRPLKRLRFLQAPRTAGGWMMLDEHTLLVSKRCSHPQPNGSCEFEEDKNSPPSRAYLKLWELITIHGIRPTAGERVFDLGACPGGWTWVLAGLGCPVVAVDKAPLDPAIAAMPGVEVLQESAFGLVPKNFGKIDWLYSDIICYPEKLLQLVRRWQSEGNVANFVCTVKLQGDAVEATLASFRAIPNSRLIHLYANKHEVTWVCLAQPKE